MPAIAMCDAWKLRLGQGQVRQRLRHVLGVLLRRTPGSSGAVEVAPNWVCVAVSCRLGIAQHAGVAGHRRDRPLQTGAGALHRGFGSRWCQSARNSASQLVASAPIRSRAYRTRSSSCRLRSPRCWHWPAGRSAPSWSWPTCHHGRASHQRSRIRLQHIGREGRGPGSVRRCRRQYRRRGRRRAVGRQVADRRVDLGVEAAARVWFGSGRQRVWSSPRRRKYVGIPVGRIERAQPPAAGRSAPRRRSRSRSTHWMNSKQIDLRVEARRDSTAAGSSWSA